MKSFSIKKLCAAVALSVASSTALAGPVILGGDDLTDHGSRSGLGVNLLGWKYIELATSNLLTSQTRGGTITTDIVALGSAADLAFSASNAGGAIGSAANVLGKTVTFFDGVTAINQFFSDLLAGLINPRMIWLAGTGATNDLDILEGAALTTNAAAINAFGLSGGAIMSHGSRANAYGWLSALLPGLTDSGACDSSGATLTAVGQAAFPSLTNNDIDINAGPCHSSFVGNFGGLQVLAVDAAQRPYIIGGGAGTVIQCGQPGQPVCPTNVPEPEMLPLLALGLLGLLGLRRRVAKKA